MADDIVTRLRAHLVKRDMTPRTHWDGCIESHPICALAWALDEIKELRAAGDALAEALHGWINGMDAFTDDAERLRAWQEARRG